MRVLLLSYYYPPDRAVGGQRARKVVEALRAAGHDVTVIAAGDPEAESSDPVWILRIRPLPSIRELYARLKRMKRDSGSAEAAGAEPTMQATEGNSRHVARWKRWIFSLIWLPDDRQGYVLPAVWRTMRDPAGRPDLVYSTAPPFSVHLAGLLLKLLTGARWVVEFRDPWTTNPWKPDFVRSALSDWVERRLERICLGQADLVVPVSEGIASQIRDMVPSTRIKTVRNGIEKITSQFAPASSDPSDPFTIVYVGSFYHARDPFPFLEAVASLAEHRLDAKNRIHVRFIGSADSFDGRSITDFVLERELQGFVHLEGWMEQEACLRHVQSANALLLLATQQPDQVPNKLYEYLGTRRPILAIVDDDGETAWMLRKSGGHMIVTENEADPIERAIRELKAQRTAFVGALDVLSEWTTENQMANLVAALGGPNVGG